MPQRRPLGSDRSPSPAGGPQSSGAFALRRNARVPANATQTHERDEPNRSAAHERIQPETAPPPEAEITAGRPRRGRPGFARLQASLAECSMEWAWQHPPSVVTHPGERERSAAKLLNAVLSARAPWLGGVAVALLAAGIVATLATLPSRRSPPADEVRSGEAVMAGVEVGAAPPVSAAAGRERGASDPAFGGAGAAPAVEIALLGPVLANSGEAAEMAARMPRPTAALQGAVIERPAARLLHEPPRPEFKPAEVSLVAVPSAKRARAGATP